MSRELFMVILWGLFCITTLAISALIWSLAIELSKGHWFWILVDVPLIALNGWNLIRVIKMQHHV